MFKSTRGRLVLGTAIFAFGLATGLVAQTNTDLAQRAEQKRGDLSGAPGMEVIASIVELKPGDSSDLHFHHGIETAYVLEGAMVETPNGASTLTSGTTLMGARGVKHGAFKNVDNKPLKFFVVHVVDKGKPLYDYSK